MCDGENATQQMDRQKTGTKGRSVDEKLHLERENALDISYLKHPTYVFSLCF